MRVFFNNLKAAAARSAAMEAENHFKNCAMANVNSENKLSIRLLRKMTVAFSIATLSFTAMAQDNVTNIRVQQMEHVLVITYDLALQADIEVHVSFDGGETYAGPLVHVSGAVGRRIEPNANRMIVWNAFEEFGEFDFPNTIIKIASTDSKAPKEYSRWHASANVGKSTFGWVSFGEVTRGGPLVFGADFAYFFFPWLGAGLHFNMGVCEVDFGEFIYNETSVNFGPSLFGRFEIKKGLVIVASAGAGGFFWSWSDSYAFKSRENYLRDYYINGGFVTLSANYMLTQHLGIGLKLQCTAFTDIYSWENYYGYERVFKRQMRGDMIGAGLNVNFKF